MKPVLCDWCGRNLTYTSNSEDYRILLCSEPLHSDGRGTVTDMGIEPQIDKPKHFCNLRDCLLRWVEKNAIGYRGGSGEQHNTD